MAGHRVTAAAVVVPVGTTEQYLYRGARVPAAVPEATVQRLVRRGLVAAIPDPAPAPVPVVEPETPADADPKQPEQPEPAAPARGRR